MNKKKYRRFEDARKFVHSLNTKNNKEWRTYCNSGIKPENIPSNPDSVYKSKGWTNWGDWLGTGRIAYQNRKWLPWDKAKLEYQKLAKENNIKTLPQWRKYLKTHKLPQNLPARYDYVYSKEKFEGLEN